MGFPSAVVAVVAVLALGIPAQAHAAELRAEQAPGRAALQDALDAFTPRVRLQSAGGTVGHGPSETLAALAVARAGLDGSDGLLADALLARPTDTTPVDAPTVRYDSTPQTVSTPHFRVHFVTDGEHAASPAFARSVAATMEQTRAAQVDGLGWLPPAPDGGRGGDDRTDVYLADVGTLGFLGYAATDPGQRCSDAACSGFHGYLVLDNDFAGWLAPEEILRVVAAHELNHLLQFRYSVLAESWWMEASAEWMAVHTEPDLDYSSARMRQWGGLSTLPLTDFGADSGGQARSYGSYVWNAWLAERHGPAVVRRTWELTATVTGSAVARYDAALAERGGGFADEFVAFTSRTAEWTSTGIPRADGFPDVTRTGTLTSGTTVGLDHTAYALYDVPVGGSTTVTVTTGDTVRAGAALVVRRTGGVDVVTSGLDDGTATLTADLETAERATVAVVNADAADRGSFAVTVATTAPQVAGLEVDPDLRVDGGGAGDPVGQAIATARVLFADGAADRVVLATADRFPDALAGAALAGTRGPILFTRGTGGLDPRTAAEINRVTGGNGHVLVLGGTAAVSAEAALQARAAAGGLSCATPLPVDCRFAGTGREHTAALVAEAVLAERPGQRVLVARGDDFADAVTGGAFAAATGTPVLLTPSTSANPHTVALIRSAGITEVIALGGQAAVSDEVLAALPAATRRRVSGEDRTSTASEIARVLWGEAGRGSAKVLLVNVRSEAGWQTALAASVASALLDAPQLGVENPPQGLGATTLDALRLHQGHRVQAFGDATLVGEAQLSAAVAAAR